MKTETLLE